MKVAGYTKFRIVKDNDWLFRYSVEGLHPHYGWGYADNVSMTYWGARLALWWALRQKDRPIKTVVWESK